MLQLRKSIDFVLEAEGFGELHLERLNSANLAIVGPCGQPIMTFFGATVPSKINKQEREYLFELASKFITDNADNIDQVLDYKKNPIDPKAVSDKFEINISGYGRPEASIDTKSIKFTIDLEEDNNISIYTASSSIDNVKNDLKKADEISEVLLACKKEYSKSKLREAKIKKLSKCML